MATARAPRALGGRGGSGVGEHCYWRTSYVCPMDIAEIGDRLEWANSRWRTPRRIEFLANLTRLYETDGQIVNGASLALHKCCPARGDCWRLETGRYPTVFTASDGDCSTILGESGSIFWPWIGDAYRHGGVRLTSLNLNNAHRGEREDEQWTIAVEYTIAEVVKAELEAGHKIAFNSIFHYRALCAARAVLASVDGVEPKEAPRRV